MSCTTNAQVTYIRRREVIEAAIERVSSVVAALPPGGIPQVEFESRYLTGPDYFQFSALTKRLAERRVLRIVDRMGVPYVMAPTSKRGRAKVDLPVSPEVLKMLRAILPRWLALGGLFAKDGNADLASRNVVRRQQFAAIEGLERAVAAFGLPVGEVLDALRLLSPETVKRIQRLRNGFLTGEPEKPTRRRLPNNMTLAQRIVETVRRGDQTGVTSTEIRGKLPVALRLSLLAALAGLEASGEIEAVVCRRHGARRVSKHYFVKGATLPEVDRNGVIIPRL